MKNIFCIIFISLFLLSSYSQKDNISLNHIDTTYNREIVLKHIFKRFNKVNRHYPVPYRCSYKTLGYPFFIYDLTDTLNVFSNNDSILFLNKHIYHIGAFKTYCKVSIIMIPFNRKLYFFEGLNCAKKIHKIEDVLYWIAHNYKEQLEENEIKRIINYQRYHQSFTVDLQGSRPLCESAKHKKRKNHDKIKNPIKIDLMKK